MPSRLKRKIPWFSVCENIYFTAYDPPTALTSVTMFDPVITPGMHHKAPTLTAVSSPTVDPGARKTAAGKPLAQATPSSKTHFDPEESGSNSRHDNDPRKTSNTSRDPGRQTNPNVPGLPLEPTAGHDAYQDTNQNGNSVAQNEPKQSDNANPAASKSRLTDPAAMIGGTQIIPTKAGQMDVDSKTISLPPGLPNLSTFALAGQDITISPFKVTAAGTTLRRDYPAVTVRETSVALNSAGQSLDGSKTTLLGIEPANHLVISIAGQVMTAAASAATIADTTVRTEEAAFPINGTMLPLDTGDHFVLGSNMHTSTMGGVFGTGGPSATTASSFMQGNNSNRTSNATSTSAQAYEGGAEGLNCGLLWMKTSVLVIIVIVFVDAF